MDGFIINQFRETKKDHPVVTCRCGAKVPLRFMYKCYYCYEYLCEKCAPIHFGSTREEYKKIGETKDGNQS